MCKEVLPAEIIDVKRLAARQLANYLLYDGDGLPSYQFSLFCSLIHDDDLPRLMMQVTWHEANVYYAKQEIVWE